MSPSNRSKIGVPDNDFGLNLFVIVLAFGVFVRTVCGKRIRHGRMREFIELFQTLPYTVWILIFGIGLGCIDLSHQKNDLDKSIQIWQQIDVHVLLFVFLPALLFQSAFSIDPHIIRHEALQIFCLAGPGVLISTILIGSFMKYYFSTFSWNLAILFGAMLSATDPVAVVALLKDLGVDERLGTLIEGEALMNDGTAIVFFNVMLRALTKNSCCDTLDVIAWTCRLSLGGPVLGLIIGEITVRFLNYIEDDVESEITLTIVAAYSSYILAESTPLKFSGVLAVVFCGLHITDAWISSEKSAEYLTSFWEVIEFLADTVVFAVSGLIVALKVWEGDIKHNDWGSLFLIYLLLHIVRGFIVLCSWPVLKSKNSYGKKWDYKEFCILSFCGLRGTVGLALALIAGVVLEERSEEYDERNSSIILFTMSGIVFLSLVINGSLTQPLIKYLKMDRSTSAEDELFYHSCAVVEARLQRHVDEVLKTDVFLGDARYQLVWRYIPIFCPVQYWHRIESRKIILAPNEVENALEKSTTSRILTSFFKQTVKKDNDETWKLHSKDNSVYCPPALRNIWDGYHRKYALQQDATCGHDHQMPTRSFSRSLSTASSAMATQASLSSHDNWQSRAGGGDRRKDFQRGLSNLSYNSSIVSNFGSSSGSFRPSEERHQLEMKAKRYRKLLLQTNLKLKSNLAKKSYGEYLVKGSGGGSSFCSFDQYDDDSEHDLEEGFPISREDRIKPLHLERQDLELDERFSDAVSKARTRFMTSIRAKYIANHHQGRMQPSTLRYLRESTNNCLDYPERPLRDWEFLESQMTSASLMSYLNLLQRFRHKIPSLSWLITEFVRRMVFNEVAVVQEVASEYMFTRNEVDLDELFDDDLIKAKIWQESELQMKKVLNYLHSNAEWVEISNALKTRNCATLLLKHYVQVVDELLMHGSVSELEKKKFSASTTMMLRKVRLHPIYEDTRSIKSILLEGIMGPLKHRHLAIMDHVTEEDIDELLATISPTIMKDVIFKEVFVKPHVKLFIKGKNVVFHANDESLSGKHCWFILVRGMIHAHGIENTFYDGEIDDEEDIKEEGKDEDINDDEEESKDDDDREIKGVLTEEAIENLDLDSNHASSEKEESSMLRDGFHGEFQYKLKDKYRTHSESFLEEKHDILEPGELIGWSDQILGKEMNATYITTSFCHLIAVDTRLYNKAAYDNMNIYNALFLSLALHLIPDLIGVTLHRESLNDAIFIKIKVANDDDMAHFNVHLDDMILKSYSEANSSGDSSGSDSSDGDGSDSSGGVGKERIERIKLHKPHIARVFEDFSEFESDKRSDELEISKQLHYITLEKGKWYILLRGAILGRCNSKEMLSFQTEIMKEIRIQFLAHTSLSAFNKDSSNDSLPCNQYFEYLINKLYELKQLTSNIHYHQDAPCLLKHRHGKVMVSPRTVILELPNVFKLVPMLYKLYHHAQEVIFWRHHLKNETTIQLPDTGSGDERKNGKK